MTLLTLFSAPKPFTNAHIATIQRNAIRSWLQLGPEVEVILIGEEPGLAEAAKEFGIKHLPEVKRNPEGTPLVSSIFDLARQNSSSPLLAYVNADILLMADFMAAARAVSTRRGKFLIIGQRWDLGLTDPLGFTPGWEEQLRKTVRLQGKLHSRTGSDYFIYPRGCFSDIPDFAVGRAGWDNWMIFKSRWEGWSTIDATESIEIIHQNHDYSHLPGGKRHVHLPESKENYLLAGGMHVKHFTLRDADRRLVNGKLVKFPLSSERIQRGIEVFPLVNLHWVWLGKLFFQYFTVRQNEKRKEQKKR